MYNYISAFVILRYRSIGNSFTFCHYVVASLPKQTNMYTLKGDNLFTISALNDTVKWDRHMPATDTILVQPTTYL